jgi:hypothetical protein
MPYNFRRKVKKTPSRTSPRNSRRGCLCADNTYSKKCCDGSLMAQGIGTIRRIWNDLWEKNETYWENASDDWEA